MILNYWEFWTIGVWIIKVLLYFWKKKENVVHLSSAELANGVLRLTVLLMMILQQITQLRMNLNQLSLQRCFVLKWNLIASVNKYLAPPTTVV